MQETYESLRRQSARTLERVGELGELNSRERTMLERGSLDVLFERRLASLDGMRRKLEGLTGLFGLVVLAYLALMVAAPLDLLPSGSWLRGFDPGRSSPGVLAASVLLLLMRFLVMDDLVRRREIYRGLSAARATHYESLRP